MKNASSNANATVDFDLFLGRETGVRVWLGVTK